MKISEVIVFVIYLVFMLSIGVYFFFKNRSAARRHISWAAVRWAPGSRLCPQAPPT